MNPELHPPVEQKRTIKIIEARNGYHTKIADDEYGIAQFDGQTGLLIPLPVYRVVGQEKIISLVKDQFGNIMDEDEINHAFEQKNAFVLTWLPPLTEKNKESGIREHRQEIQDGINKIIDDVERIFEEKERNRFN